MLAIFDVEGVLYDAEYLPILAKRVNKEKEIWNITKQGIQGTINWEDGLKRRVHLLKGIDNETCKEVADRRKMRHQFDNELGKVRYVNVEREKVTQIVVYSKKNTIFVTMEPEITLQRKTDIINNIKKLTSNI